MSESTEAPRRAALVTGSSRGIGRAVAERLAADGFDVCVNCSSGRTLPGAQELADSLSARYGVRAIARAANVGDSTEARGLVEAAHEAFGRLDVLVNNAGIIRDSLLVRMSDEDFEAVVDVNLKSAFYCTKAAALIMRKQRYGRIVNMSSISGVSGNVGQVNYSAAKAGLIGMTKTVARELAGRGITANAVAPGFIETDMTATLPEKVRESIGQQIPAKRFGTVEDVAALVSFLSGEQAGYITGQVICVDGGLAL